MWAFNEGYIMRLSLLRETPWGVVGDLTREYHYWAPVRAFDLSTRDRFCCTNGRRREKRFSFSLSAGEIHTRIVKFYLIFATKIAHTRTDTPHTQTRTYTDMLHPTLEVGHTSKGPLSI